MNDDCACIYGGNDEGEYSPDFQSLKWVKARKPHKCCECRRQIQPGESYLRYTGKWDGEMNTYRTCAVCEDIRSSLCCGGSFIFGDLWEKIHDQIFCEKGLTIACIDKLTTVAAKEKLQTAWMEFVAERGQ